MKLLIRIVAFWLICVNGSFAQITFPVIKARFGVDADLRANFFNGSVQTANDDWFNLVATDTSGKYVIDTTGAAGIVAGYLTDVSPWPKRMQSLYRTMNRPAFSVVNNRLWLDAIWVRDYHGNDTTVFTAGSDKNGMSPASWTGGVQSIPDKNDILDMFVHVRRAGPNAADSLWLFGGLSLDNTTGNRYFDFEMYQTDIYYDRVSGRWYGYGPDFGHTSWQFDAAGNVTRPGDIIFSAEYQSSTLTNIEARVWVQKTVWQTTTPTAFNWSGQFDGASAGATYGYASILPKTGGTFYTGMGSAVNTWAGPFRVVLQDNTLATNYAKDQFMEFSVNLSKLGLDPVTLIGGDICGTPFNRIVVKTRASSSFTAELKDFVAPTDLFLSPRVQIATQTPYICDTGSIAQIYVTNPVASAFYQWYTPNGNIVGPTTGTSIIVDTPGIYIVRHYLQAGCSEYARDTLQVYAFSSCDVLNSNLYAFSGVLRGTVSRLEWKVLYNQVIDHFIVERSTDGIRFTPIGQLPAIAGRPGSSNYTYTDSLQEWRTPYIYYRIRMQELGKTSRYSQVIKISLQPLTQNEVTILPNPAREVVQLQVLALKSGELKYSIFNAEGKLIIGRRIGIQKGFNAITLGELSDHPRGVYHAMIFFDNQIFPRKVLLVE